MSPPSTVLRVTDENLPALLAAEQAVLILTKSNCGYCAAYQADIEALQARGDLAGLTIGKVVLDQPGAGRFKRDNPWLARLDFLPYNLVYRRGQEVDRFAASRASYLQQRVAATLVQDA